MRVDAVVPIFFVADVPAAIAYYVETLGFTEAFRYGTYAGVRIGEREIHLTDPGEARQIVGAGTAYVICDAVDDYYAQVRGAGAKIKEEPADRPYGMRDFAVVDLDGNQLTFGCETEERAT